MKALSYCEDLVRAHDPDRFLITMLMPADKRSDLCALFAFNYEIAKTREVVSETQLGLIRLQWWHEGIAEIYDGASVREHAVLLALQDAIKRYDLPQALFEKLIYAREFDLEDVMPASLEGLKHYADFTSTPLLKLSLMILGQKADEEVIQQVGVNYAISGLLKSFVFHAQQCRLYLPQDLVDRYKVKPSRLYALKDQDGLSDVIKAVAGLVDFEVSTRIKFLKLMNAVAVMRAKQLQRYGYNPLHPKALLPAPFQVLRLVAKSLMP